MFTNMPFRLLCLFALFTLAAAPAERPVLIAVTVHADDASIFAGGAIAKFLKESHDGYLIRITDDEKDGIAPAAENSLRNTRELDDAARILGFRGVFSLNYKNDELDPVTETEMREKIILLIRHLKPRVIFTFDPWAAYEENPDHLKAARAVEDACWTAGVHLFHPEQLRAGLRPHYLTDRYYWARGPHVVNEAVDISTTIETKLAAVRAHRGMIREDGPLAEIRDAAARIGRLHGMKYAETYHRIGLGSPSSYVMKNAVRVEGVK